MPGSWADFLKLRSGPAPPPSSEAGAVRVYADTGGALRSVQSDGTDAAIGGGGGSTTLHTATVTLTDAQIKTLHTTPMVVIADPGDGKFIIPQTVMLRMAPANFVNYTNIDATAQIFLADLLPVFSETAPESSVSGLLADTGYGNAILATEQVVVSSIGYTRPNFAWADSDLTGALHISMNNGASGDLDGGDAGNTLQIASAYLIFDTATGSFV